MPAARRRWAADILHFWFHKLGPVDRFQRDDAVDAELARRYGRLLTALSNGAPGDFLTGPDEARAAILLFDQCPRNLFRDDPRAFAFDPLARAICKGAIARGWDKGLGKSERQFLCLPLMHSEDIADQLLSLEKFTSLGDAYITGFARDHYRMIARFGRFPHRNEVLGRKSTAAELRAIAAGHAW